MDRSIQSFRFIRSIFCCPTSGATWSSTAQKKEPTSWSRSEMCWTKLGTLGSLHCSLLTKNWRKPCTKTRYSSRRSRRSALVKMVRRRGSNPKLRATSSGSNKRSSMLSSRRRLRLWHRWSRQTKYSSRTAYARRSFLSRLRVTSKGGKAFCSWSDARVLAKTCIRSSAWVGWRAGGRGVQSRDCQTLWCPWKRERPWLEEGRINWIQNSKVKPNSTPTTQTSSGHLAKQGAANGNNLLGFFSKRA